MTITDLVQQLIDRKRALRVARITAAKTNLERLMAEGVIVTCDDEMESAYRWQHRSDLAKEARVDFQKMDDACEFAQLATAVIDSNLSVAENGETSEEHSARVKEAIAKLPQRTAPGKKKPCKHNSTTREGGLFSLGCYRAERYIENHLVVGYVDRFVCQRCALEVEIPHQPPVLTSAAREAAKIYLQLSNDTEKAREIATKYGFDSSEFAILR